MHQDLWRRIALVPTLLVLAGCGERINSPPTDTVDTKHPTSVELPVLGAGAVPERYTGEVAERGGFAYTSTWYRRSGNVGNVVKVWDVRGATPVLTDSLVVQGGALTTGDVEISDDGQLLAVPTEYGTQDGIAIFSRADPAHPKLRSFFTSPDTHSPGVHTAKLGRVNGRLFAFLAIDPSPPELVVVDLSDPSNPRQVLARTMGNPFIHDTHIRDGLLFTTLWNDGFTIWDIGGGSQGGTPANPVSLGSGQTVGGADHNLCWLHTTDGGKRFVFVGEEQAGQIGVASAGDIHVVDISDMAHPKEVAFYHVDGAGTHNFSVDEAHGILYAAYYNGGVRALDVRGDLSSCAAPARAADGRCDLALEGREAGHGLTNAAGVYVWGVVFDAGKLYVSDMVHGLYVLDASALNR